MNQPLLLILYFLAVGVNAHDWRDPSPHTTGFVRVDGIRLNYLDWGGKGEVLLFIHGWGDNAHAFDVLAPRFTNTFHCIAFTRRGSGQSDKPQTGYDPATCTEEVRGFMDGLGITRAFLVGHSYGGQIISLLATRYPSRVQGLIFLDGIFDYSPLEYQAWQKFYALFPYPSATSTDLANINSYRAYEQKACYGGKPSTPFWNDALEAQLRDNVRIVADGSVQLITSTVEHERFSKEALDPDPRWRRTFRSIQCPSLAISSEQPWWDVISPERWPKNKTDVDLGPWIAYQQACYRQYRENIRNGKLVILPHANHDAFNQMPEKVDRLMSDFFQNTKSNQP